MSASEHKLAFIKSFSTFLNKNELIQPTYLKTHKVIYIKKSDLIRNMVNEEPYFDHFQKYIVLQLCVSFFRVGVFYLQHDKNFLTAVCSCWKQWR